MPILMFHKALERLPRGADHAIRMEPFLESSVLDEPFVHTLFEAAFRPVLQGEVDFIKFPQLALSIDFILEQFPDSHVVGVWREPISTFRSLVQKEFPAEMRPASSIKSILLWNLYARHLCQAHARHPDRFTLVSIDDFLADRDQGKTILRRIGFDSSNAADPFEILDLRIWQRQIPLLWKAHHRFSKLVAKHVAIRLGGERAELASQDIWARRLRQATLRAG
jgi:hypothetical protein